METDGMDRVFAPWRLDWVTRDRDDSQDCIFCELAETDNDRSNRILTRSERAYTVLNKAPYNPGHVLVVPCSHGEELVDLEETALREHYRLIQKTVKAIRLCMGPDGFNIGTNVGVAGGASINDHLHTHVVPRWDGDTTFMPTTANTTIVPDALDATYDRLHEAFSEIDGVSREQPYNATILEDV